MGRSNEIQEANQSQFSDLPDRSNLNAGQLMHEGHSLGLFSRAAGDNKGMQNGALDIPPLAVFQSGSSSTSSDRHHHHHSHHQNEQPLDSLAKSLEMIDFELHVLEDLLSKNTPTGPLPDTSAATPTETGSPAAPGSDSSSGGSAAQDTPPDITPISDGTAGTGSDQPPPGYVDVRTFGAVGDGVHDDTEAFQQAAATGKNIWVPDTPDFYKISGRINLQASIMGQDIAGQARPEIRMFGADGQRDESHVMFQVKDYNGSGLEISGLHLNGQYDGTGTDGEWSHLVEIKGSKNVTVDNNTLEKPYGDCVLIGGEGDPQPSKNILIENNEMDGPRRCDVAVISADGVTIENNSIKKENNYVTAIDLEPNPGDPNYVKNVTIANNSFDVSAIAVSTYTPDGIAQGSGLTMENNTGKAWLFYTNGHGPEYSQLVNQNNNIAPVS